MVGTVTDNSDITKNGQFKVAFGTGGVDKSIEEIVTYVSPMGNNKAAWVGVPLPGSLVLCMEEDFKWSSGEMSRGLFYMGSIMGDIPGRNMRVPREGTPEDTVGRTPADESHPFPDKFRDMYDAKGIVPEKVGFTTLRGDAVLIANRYRSNLGVMPFQDHKVALESGSGKRVALVDSPIVDGIVITPKPGGQDYMIFSRGNSPLSPFAAGEWHVRTHGPIHEYTTGNGIRHWVEEGLNLEIENRATGSLAPTDSAGARRKLTTNSGGYIAGRQGEFANEEWGCVKLLSDHNNISLSALGEDSVIHIHASGTESKIIIDTGGTVDVYAKKKITLQSDEEIEINAPLVDINGSDHIYMDAPMIDFNLPHSPPEM